MDEMSGPNETGEVTYLGLLNEWYPEEERELSVPKDKREKFESDLREMATLFIEEEIPGFEQKNFDYSLESLESLEDALKDRRDILMMMSDKEKESNDFAVFVGGAAVYFGFTVMSELMKQGKAGIKWKFFNPPTFSEIDFVGMNRNKYNFSPMHIILKKLADDSINKKGILSHKARMIADIERYK